MKKLYSVDEPMSDEQFEEISKYYHKLASREGVYFIETLGTAKQIANSILSYWKNECAPYNKVCVYEIDHALLTLGKQGDSEKERVDELMYALVRVKKLIAAAGGHSIGIVLSQMNRNIRDKDRIKNKELHRPGSECLFGASSIEMCADYIIFAHTPAKLNITSYTPMGLPTYYQIRDKKYKLPYLELVKQRSGESDLTIPLWNNLEYFDLNEMELNLFNHKLAEFRETGVMVFNPQ